ncbi:MAG TPA: MFS transporter [Candidatus Paceibacterota bacterium]
MTRNIFLAGFSLTLSAALAYYVNSSFLGTIVGEKNVGFVYALAALVAMLTISLIPTLGQRFGILKPSRWFAIAFFIGIITLAMSRTPVIEVLAFIISYSSIVGLGLWLDIYLETLSSDKRTGRIRGGYLTTINAAVLIAPYISGQSIDYTGSYQTIYWLSGLVALPLLYQMFWRLTDRPLPANGLRLWEKLRDLNLRKILVIDFLLNLFYFFMVIYLPIYLHDTLAFDWGKIGLIFTIMLLPFVLIEYPLGWLADRKLGEKEILSLGLIIAALATIPIASLTSQSFAVWAGLLFLTRVGASAIESMKETYLFKKVSAGDLGVISLSRLTIPLAYLTGSLASIIMLQFFSLLSLFIFISFLLLLGLYFSLTLEDTR